MSKKWRWQVELSLNVRTVAERPVLDVIGEVDVIRPPNCGSVCPSNSAPLTPP